MAAESYYDIKLDGLKALMKGLDSIPKKIPNVTSASINEAVDKMYTEAWRTIKPQFYVKQKYFSRATKKIRANPSTLNGALVATGKHLTLSRFKYTPTRPSAGRIPVSVAIGPNISQAIPAGIFVAKMPTGYRGVFMRVGRKRFPIQQPLSDYGAAEMLGQDLVKKALEKVGKESFDKEFRRLTNVLLNESLKNLPK